MISETYDGHGTMDDMDDYPILSDKRIGKGALSIYALLLKKADSSNRCEYSFSELAATLPMSRKAVITAVQKLEELGYIKKIRRTADNGLVLGNIYILLK